MLIFSLLEWVMVKQTESKLCFILSLYKCSSTDPKGLYTRFVRYCQCFVSFSVHVCKLFTFWSSLKKIYLPIATKTWLEYSLDSPASEVILFSLSEIKMATTAETKDPNVPRWSFLCTICFHLIFWFCSPLHSFKKSPCRMPT